MKIHRIIFLSFIFLFTSSCNLSDKKFNSQIWKTADGFHNGERKHMLNDLLKNHLKEGMAYSEIINLIGEPSELWVEESNMIVYDVYEDFGWDIDPVGMTLLYLKIGRDSTLSERKVKQITIK